VAPRQAKIRDNRAAIAAQFGISLKALRLYEELGMLKPPRTDAGWRIYGAAEIERLHAILSLKQLGLPLARIAELLTARVTDMGALLSVQEQMLLQTRRNTDHALDLVRIAKVRVREGDALSADDLAKLIGRISKALVPSTPEIEALMRESYTPEQLAVMQIQRTDEDVLARAAEGWAQIQDGLDALLPDGDPLSDKALDIARRAVSLMQMYTRGDRELWNNSYKFWKSATSDPAISNGLLMTKQHFDFLGVAMNELKKRGELKP
jgi:DNA-binding transcriptional MerR regulator